MGERVYQGWRWRYDLSAMVLSIEDSSKQEEEIVEVVGTASIFSVEPFSVVVVAVVLVGSRRSGGQGLGVGVGISHFVSSRKKSMTMSVTPMKMAQYQRTHRQSCETAM